MGYHLDRCISMPKLRLSHVKRRSIILKIEIYEYLKRFLLELMKKRGAIASDDVVNALLDEYERRGGING